MVVAVLLDDRGDAIALVESGPDNTTRVTLLERPDVPAGHVMQVWTKPEEDGPPVSLGLLTSGLSRVLSVQGLPEPHPAQLYEITFEPAGGSPTNLPTGQGTGDMRGPYRCLRGRSSWEATHRNFGGLPGRAARSTHPFATIPIRLPPREGPCRYRSIALQAGHRICGTGLLNNEL
jgi:hypothetical protein